ARRQHGRQRCAVGLDPVADHLLERPHGVLVHPVLRVPGHHGGAHHRAPLGQSVEHPAREGDEARERVRPDEAVGDVGVALQPVPDGERVELLGGAEGEAGGCLEEESEGAEHGSRRGERGVGGEEAGRREGVVGEAAGDEHGRVDGGERARGRAAVGQE
ncbi:Os11g0483975, partial [Oryza sativa Japonica Group]